MASHEQSTIDPQALRPGGDAKVMTLIGVGHFVSHFYILILPPLFPLLKTVYGVGYLQLGLAVGLLNIVTALTQAPVGFLVDRFGARGILIAGLALFALAIGMIGIVPTYPALILLMIIGGIGNSVFHPADYSILSSAVDSRRMGRAFSIHTFAGYAGFAAAPPIIVFLTAMLGWRWALTVCGAAGLVVALWMLLDGAALERDRTRPAHAGRAAARTGADIRMLLSFPLLLALVMFAMLALSHGGLTSYSVAALEALYAVPLAQANAPLTAYLLVSTAGVLAGGWIADRTVHHDRLAALYMVMMALLIWPVGSFALPLWQIMLLIGAAGFFAGAIAPSRDMMVRAITPEGASGKVFGFVTSGFNIGGIVAPFIFGLVMDRGMPGMVFWLVALFCMATLLAIFASGRQARLRRQAG